MQLPLSDCSLRLFPVANERRCGSEGDRLGMQRIPTGRDICLKYVIRSVHFLVSSQFAFPRYTSGLSRGMLKPKCSVAGTRLTWSAIWTETIRCWSFRRMDDWAL